MYFTFQRLFSLGCCRNFHHPRTNFRNHGLILGRHQQSFYQSVHLQKGEGGWQQIARPITNFSRLHLGPSYRTKAAYSNCDKQVRRTYVGVRQNYLSLGTDRKLSTALISSTFNCVQQRQAGHWEMAAEKAKLRFLKNREKRAQSDRSPQQSSVVSLQIIGDGSIDCPPSFLIITDTSRYIFNCGEGTQRLLMECGTRNLSKLEHIFMTRMSWENVGGAVGMTITLKNIGIPRLTMYGPPSLTEFRQALQIFAKHEAIDVELKPYTEGPFTNDTMVITPVPIFPTKNEDVVSCEDNTPSTDDMEEDHVCPGTSDEESGSLMPEGGQVVGKRKSDSPLDVIADMSVIPQLTGNSAKRKKMEKVEDFTIAYICKLHDKPGKLLAEKAIKMGLKPNLHFVSLKSGQAVTLEDGRTIQPEEVVGPAIPGQVFIVLECPSVNYIDSVVSSERFERHFAGHGVDTASLVLHMSSEEVLNDAKYQAWIARFGSEAEHVIFNKSCKSLRFDASRGQQTMLNQLHEGIFPILPSHTPSSPPIPPRIKVNGSEYAQLMYAEIYHKIHLKPARGWERDAIIPEDRQRFLEELGDLEDYQQSLKTLRTSLQEAEHDVATTTAAGAVGSKYPEVVFLGTGSAMPNKARNVSGILLNFSENKSMIMDCGEGTFGQLSRYYGDKLDEVIASIQCIFISHIHADHHAGLINLLRHWKRVTNPVDGGNNLILIGPKRMFIWLNIYDNHCEPFIQGIRFVDLADLNIKLPKEERSRHETSLLSRLNLTELHTVYVRHCANAYGVTMTHQDGWKLVYSGDTMPSNNLIEAGKGADLLIHEATLEDGMEEEAKKKRHSMISQAIEVGQSMEAKFLLLTHFSQRYPKVPLIDTASSARIGIAFDNMRVSLSELETLPLLLPTLRHLFASEIQELEDLRERKAEKKQQLKNKESSTPTKREPSTS